MGRAADLGNILTILSGSSDGYRPRRSEAPVLCSLQIWERVIRPSYGLIEATVCVATSKPGQPPETVDFDTESFIRRPCEARAATLSLISYMLPRSPIIRIVDSDTCIDVGRNRRRDLGARRQRR